MGPCKTCGHLPCRCAPAHGLTTAWHQCTKCPARQPKPLTAGLCVSCYALRAGQAPNTKMGEKPFLTRSAPKLPQALWFNRNGGSVFCVARDEYGNVVSTKLWYPTDLADYGLEAYNFELFDGDHK